MWGGGTKEVDLAGVGEGKGPTWREEGMTT